MIRPFTVLIPVHNEAENIAPLRAGERFARLLPFLVALLCGAAFFHWAARDGWFIHTDAPAFVPPMLSQARDEGLLNTYQPSARLWDPLRQGRQIGHGFLPSLFYGGLAPGTTYRSIHYTMAATSLLSLLLFAGLLIRLTPARTSLRGIVPALGVFAAALMLWRLEGRPEGFVFFIVCLSGHFWLSLALAGRLLVAGFALSSIAVSSPVAALLVGALFLAWCGNQPPAEALRRFCVAGAAALAGFVLWFALYPYPMADWLHGHLSHASATIMPAHRDVLTMLRHWAFRALEGMPGACLALGAGAGLWLAARRAKPFVWPGLLLFFAVAWYFGLRQGFPTYNLDWLAPLALLPLALAASRLENRPRGIALCLLAALCAVPAYAFTTRQIKIAQGLLGGPSPSEVRIAAEALAAANPDNSIRLSRHFFQLVEPRKNWVRYHEFGPFPLPDEKDAGFFLSQAEARSVEPPQLPGWRLAAHNFHQPATSGARLRVPYSSLGFAYALYVPEKITATAASTSAP